MYMFGARRRKNFPEVFQSCEIERQGEQGGGKGGGVPPAHCCALLSWGLHPQTPVRGLKPSPRRRRVGAPLCFYCQSRSLGESWVFESFGRFIVVARVAASCGVRPLWRCSQRRAVR